LYTPDPTIRYRYPSGARSSQRPKYPRPSLILDYFLPEEADTLVRLEVLDAGGKVLTAISSDSLATEVGEDRRDMATGFVEDYVDEALTAESGLNRFHWDMTLSGPWNSDTKRRYRNGPLASPGTYTVRLKVGEEVLEQQVELLMDPRVTAAGVRASDVQAQLQFLMEIRDGISETLQFQQEVEEAIETLEEKKRRSEVEAIRLEELHAILNEIKTEEGIYMQPMLADQWRYLYNMLRQADQLPGKDARDRFAELQAQLQELKKRFNP
jgi:hypothetical protein